MSSVLETLVDGAPAVDDGEFGPARARALEILRARGFPTRKTEAWKYTPLARLEQRELAVAGPATGEVPDAPSLPFEAAVLHWHNGVLDPSRSDLPRGITLTGLVPGDVDASRLDADSPADAFSWLNLARFEQGWRVFIDETPDLPLVLVSTWDDDFSAAAFPRVVVELAPDTEAVLVEWQQGSGEGLIASELGIELARAASLTHAVRREAGGTALIQRTHVEVRNGASYRGIVVDGGGSLTRQDLGVDLLEAGARAGIHGVGMLSGQSLVDYHTAIRHRVGGTNSEEDFRLLADDRSVGVFNGRILIVPGADDSHSTMNTGNLLLGENARINIKPELEIHAEEVTASHGATIGQLEDDARFYLRSRGLDEQEATALLKYGFAAAVLDALPAGDLRDWLDGAVHEHLRDQS
ncbi:MAG: SufD family Fe-S cluster assembly protein [Wenzhouxiangellaceae bacterium]|nr:SufD family Fe-S cluster assembly protein [Wenzhouxiangellaceae bacterium]